MESFEHVCKVALEWDGFVVTSGVKFPVTRRTKKRAYEETQTHGYEVDLVGANRNKLILAECKSYLASAGVLLSDFDLDDPKGFKMINDPQLRRGMVSVACERYGYSLDQVSVRLYAGNVKRKRGQTGRSAEAALRDRLTELGVTLVTLQDIVSNIRAAAGPTHYLNDPVLMTVKALVSSGHLEKMEP